MDNNTLSLPKRGRPASTPAQPAQPVKPDNSERNAVALAVLQGVVGSGVAIDNKFTLCRWCFDLADVFIEVANERE